MIGFLAISGVGTLLWFAPPLLRSSGYDVRYEIDGRAYSDAKLFKPLGMSSRYYVRFPSVKNGYYGWIGIDFERGVAVIPLFGVRCPCGTPCVHRDQAFGVKLTDGKVQADWQVSVALDSVTLTSSEMSVWMEKQVR